MDNLSELQELFSDIFTDPCWRGSHLPFDHIEIRVRSVIEKLGIEERRYREIIRQQEDMIRKLATQLDNYTKFGY